MIHIHITFLQRRLLGSDKIIYAFLATRAPTNHVLVLFQPRAGKVLGEMEVRAAHAILIALGLLEGVVQRGSLGPAVQLAATAEVRRDPTILPKSSDWGDLVDDLLNITQWYTCEIMKQLHGRIGYE